MTFKIITADERAAAPRSTKGVIFGPHKIGKTSLLWTLPADSTLFLNLEAGELSVQGWQGDSINIRTWLEARDMACLVGGPDPSKRADQAYSQAHYDYLAEQHADFLAPLGKYQIHFWDSISVATRLCFQWAGGEPESFSDRTGKKDIRGTYGLIGREIVEWLTHIQHTPGKDVWVVGGLDGMTDDFGRVTWRPQIEGQQATNKLPGIFDEIVCMVELQDDNDQPYRAFVCQRVNPWSYPAGDRSGRLDMVEPPHLGNLMEKIAGPVRPIDDRLDYTMPAEGETND